MMSFSFIDIILITDFSWVWKKRKIIMYFRRNLDHISFHFVVLQWNQPFHMQSNIPNLLWFMIQNRAIHLDIKSIWIVLSNLIGSFWLYSSMEYRLFSSVWQFFWSFFYEPINHCLHSEIFWIITSVEVARYNQSSSFLLFWRVKAVSKFNKSPPMLENFQGHCELIEIIL